MTVGEKIKQELPNNILAHMLLSFWHGCKDCIAHDTCPEIQEMTCAKTVEHVLNQEATED